MNLYKLAFLICVLFGYIVVGLPTLDSHDDQLVWVGQTVALPCGKHNGLGTHRRSWHKDSELLTAGSLVMTLDERVTVTDNGTLEISKATFQDSGQYKCVVNSHPKPTTHKINVTVEQAPSITCSTPESIANGDLHFSIKREDAIFIFGDRVRYTCHTGFSLVGSEFRNCSLPDRGWDGEAPSCVCPDRRRIIQPSQLSGPELAAAMKIGTRVVRGIDWDWGSQDGLPPGEGTVIVELNSSGWITVQWEDGRNYAYRMGNNGKYELKLAEPLPTSETVEDLATELRCHLKSLETRVKQLEIELADVRNRSKFHAESTDKDVSHV